ncbi:chemotaxis protein CheX [Paenibacillus roseipurpureus]|uniref:Chemotaxis protein CheX n=1 Tax=Paenibacillus roseopurpureus TaxID=2918901 RepID=A0AA96LKE0_9BACL|nr:chemotaxis protein CheX [Paenibacillus sp. MBLB1832]WNR42676.1 chemotaxis protein CheX [Paenibacillus sp. MBLB1832]
MVENMQNLLLDSVRTSIGNIIPRPLSQAKVCTDNEPLIKDEIGVAIQFTNSDYCMVLDGQRVVFSRISEAVFGMYMEGEMLDSCVSEIANIIAGGTTTILGEQGISLDITTPSLLEDNFDWKDQGNKLTLPISIDAVGEIRVVLMEGNS